MSLAMIFQVKKCRSRIGVGFKNADVATIFQLGSALPCWCTIDITQVYGWKVFGICHSHLQVLVVGKAAFVFENFRTLVQAWVYYSTVAQI